MENILVSACLLGVSCRYDAKSKPNENVIGLITVSYTHLRHRKLL